MTLEEQYNNKPLEVLVEIVERSEGYTTEAMRAVATALKERKVTPDALKAVAEELLKQQIHDYLENFSVINDELSLPSSNILAKEEVVTIFKEIFLQWKQENDDMIPDGFKYILGAAFG